GQAEGTSSDRCGNPGLQVFGGSPARRSRLQESPTVRVREHRRRHAVHELAGADARSREVFTFHRPEELLRLVSLDAQVRGKLTDLPALDSSKLWSVQKRAIENLEQSLAKNNPRSLIQMAAGSGKTFTAVNACYRLIKFGGARRVLFLVDRRNFGRQTYREFQQFVSPVNA